MSSDDPKKARPGPASEVEADLRRLFTLSLDLMCIAGFDGYFKRVNPAFEQALGYSSEELLKRQFIDFVHPDDRQSTLAEVDKLSAGQVTIDFENRYRTRDGDYRWLDWRSAPMVDRGLIYAVARDVTEQKANQELLTRQARELERSNSDLEQFAHVASHDLRAPLRSIVTLTGFLEEELEGDVAGKAAEHLRELKRRALLMRALTEDLLVYSQAGREPRDVVEVDVAELVRDIVFLLDPPAGFSVETDESLPVFETVRTPLEQVLRNLIANAIKHHDRDRGEIRIAAREAGDQWEFLVADDGPSIAEGDRSRVFRVFEQLAPDGGGEGSGMGLSLVRRIVERFGGRVALDPGTGRGSTFRFEWPRRIEENPDPAPMR